MRAAFGFALGSFPLALVLSCGAFGSASGNANDDAGGDASFADTTSERSEGGSTSTRIVFVTKDWRFPTDLGGVAGADAFCASQAAMPGSLTTNKPFRAWVSNATSSAASRLTDKSAARPFVRTDGTVVASGWGAYASDVHQAPIDHDQFGAQVDGDPLTVWTATDSMGNHLEQSGKKNCSGLAQNSVNDDAVVGSLKASDTQWSNAQLQSCQFEARVYCVEDP